MPPIWWRLGDVKGRVQALECANEEAGNALRKTGCLSAKNDIDC